MHQVITIEQKTFSADKVLLWGNAQAPDDIGPMTVAAIDDHIVNVNFGNQLLASSKPGEKMLSAHQQRRRDDQWAQQTIDKIIQITQNSVSELLRQQSSTLKLAVDGTDFQYQVWQALLTIPFGQQKSYKQIAMLVNQVDGVRAVAQAIGANPLGYIVPCHRVIRDNGELGGFAGGIIVKEALLRWESSQKAA
ncbi:MAG: methylated-DNA--[protein]-cysteine S-methyltransferase [Gammaproteobacteria bacterium]|nr:methylated-DNA--[protein]-cysteine S-methyltransferase [Gammaproteobacteria bacterium]